MPTYLLTRRLHDLEQRKKRVRNVKSPSENAHLRKKVTGAQLSGKKSPSVNISRKISDRGNRKCRTAA